MSRNIIVSTYFDIYFDGEGPASMVYTRNSLNGFTSDGRIKQVYNKGDDFVVLNEKETATIKKNIESGKVRFSFTSVLERFDDPANQVFGIPIKLQSIFVNVKGTERDADKDYRIMFNDAINAMDAAQKEREPVDAVKFAEMADVAFRELYPDDAARLDALRKELHPDDVAKLDNAAKLDKRNRGMTAEGTDRLTKYFTTTHLPEHLVGIGNVYVAVASALNLILPPGPERTVALRKLLESKDAAIRAQAYPEKAD